VGGYDKMRAARGQASEADDAAATAAACNGVNGADAMPVASA